MNKQKQNAADRREFFVLLATLLAKAAFVVVLAWTLARVCVALT